MRLRLCFYLTVFLFLSCSSPQPVVNTDQKLQSDITKILKIHIELEDVRVGVKDGVATLTGFLPFEEHKALAGNLSRIDGIRDVRNNITIPFPTPLPSDESVLTDDYAPTSDVKNTQDGFTGSKGDEPSADWIERGNTYLIEYMKPRMVNCGDSYFLISDRSGLYQTKKEPFPEVYDSRILPAESLSEADRLNGKKKALPERFDGRWRVKIESPWRSFGDGRWGFWRNDDITKDQNLDYTSDEKWEVGPSLDGNFKIIGKYKCYGNDVDIDSIPGSPTDK